MIKKYLRERKQVIKLYSYQEVAMTISITAQRMLNEKRTHKVQYFIKKCEEMRNALLRDLDNNKSVISDEKYSAVKQLIITDLNDCEVFSKILLGIFNELKKGNKTKFLTYPFFIGDIPLTVFELSLLFLLGVCISVLI